MINKMLDKFEMMVSALSLRNELQQSKINTYLIT
jgi:hypothetical protein